MTISIRPNKGYPCAMWMITHAHGNPNVRSVLKVFCARQGNLRFETILAFPNLTIIHKLSRKFKLFNQISLKTYSHVPFRFIKLSYFQFLVFGINRISPFVHRESLQKIRNYRMAESKLDLRASKILMRNNEISMVYGYQGMCINQFIAAKKKGMTTVLELPNSLTFVHDQITRIESENFLEWNFESELKGDREKLYVQETAELDLADWIIVPSNQVKNSIVGQCEASKVVTIPYAITLSGPSHDQLLSAKKNRVLIVSRLISTKGIHYLEEATRSLKYDFELFIVGSLPPNPSNRLMNFLNRHQYLGNISRNQIIDLMRTCEIFILPSLIEGRSLSSLEAISQGLIPVLTSGTGADDVVKENGILIPSCNSSAIRDALISLLTMENSKKLEMRMRSLEIADNMQEKIYLNALDDFFASLEK